MWCRVVWNHHHVVCITTGPCPLPKRVLHGVHSSASTFNFLYLRVSLKSSSTCLRLLLPLPVTSIFPSITCFRMRLPCKLWQTQLGSVFLLYVGYFSLTVCNTSSFLTWSVQLIFSFFLLHHILKLSRYSLSTFGSVQFSPPDKDVLH
jgi:hypothetical protein